MARIKVNAKTDPVGAAIAEGKFGEDRREYWQQRVDKEPKKTRRLLAKLEGGLVTPPEEMELLTAATDEGRRRQAKTAAFGGPTSYPREWLGPAAGSGNVFTDEPEVHAASVSPGDGLTAPGGSVTFEDAAVAAAAEASTQGRV